MKCHRGFERCSDVLLFIKNVLLCIHPFSADFSFVLWSCIKVFYDKVFWFHVQSTFVSA